MRKKWILIVSLFLIVLFYFICFFNLDSCEYSSTTFIPQEIIIMDDYPAEIQIEEVDSILSEENNVGENNTEIVEETFIEETPIEETQTYYSASYFINAGIIYWDGWQWTWYSQRVLPGGGLNIPGRHVDENGYVCDENDYICLASSSLGWGTIVNTPFGKMGKFMIADVIQILLMYM